MYPWLWLWAPQIRLPWSGDVLQDIDPTTNWFFGSIKPDAGVARIEQKAFEVASYGRQIGLLTDVLIELADQNVKGTGPSDAAAKALDELKRIRSEIEKIKTREYAQELQDLESRIALVRGKVAQRDG